MKKRVLSFIASAAILATAAAPAQAEQVVVHKGDTLWDFSKAYGVSVESIKKLNNLTSHLIYPNDVLEISPSTNYVVEKGDTLWGISQEHGITVDQLMEWNNLTCDLIHPGLNLTIFTDVQNNTKIEAESVKTENSAKENTNTETVSLKQTAASKQDTTSQQTNEEPEGKEIIVVATAYTASCEGCSGITATGINLKENPDAKVISVDPSVIPLGSKVYVEGYGYATAADTGGAIKGNKIDVFIPDYEEAVQWGRKQVKVTIIE
ncbi:3D (Asp-Asp-Asp) domain-containing protein [Bacillus oleivorans]|uniref:3D (Asp-Asp-Asp) domain-containing protein n=1 Tax=Bacillus oleivorans TaxID=1448271 RepID=A0A285D027_9BACI|nr:3D domain-containing protein [Bacillus oleivorans]SNX72656.1 3D (Asp-Asp-Asp) domain-containing protein [Bacillus oleivorans]